MSLDQDDDEYYFLAVLIRNYAPPIPRNSFSPSRPYLYIHLAVKDPMIDTGLRLMREGHNIALHTLREILNMRKRTGEENIWDLDFYGLSYDTTTLTSKEGIFYIIWFRLDEANKYPSLYKIYEELRKRYNFHASFEQDSIILTVW